MSGPRLWGGRQSGALDPAFEAFNRSLPFDRRLVDEDLVGSMAWARALGGAGVLESADVDALVAALADSSRTAAAWAAPSDASKRPSHLAFRLGLAAAASPS